MKRIAPFICCLFALATAAFAQQQIESKVSLAFNRFYDYDAMSEAMHQLVAAYPELLSIQSLGKSIEGRDMWMVTLNNPKTGPDTDKPAMWIDGNIHGNEIQAGEVVLYSIWYLTKSYGKVESLTKLMDRCAFYFLPMVNPDGRDDWFETPATPHNYRTGLRPTDNDFDGMFDEDPPDDLDGDGHIGVMWRFDPNGNYRRNRDEPRIIERVTEPGIKGELSFGGGEGIDNDGDGQTNEDDRGGYDMNRNWPAGWEPDHIQFGAGEYPLSVPETNSVAQFVMAHANIAAGQAYHNSGGMILRGPGAAFRTDLYPGEDKVVYERLGRAGEEMLPFYRYMVIYSDLYVVHGGYVNWLAEGLGIVSFTNELWPDQRILQNPALPYDEKAELRWQDRMLFGQTLTNWTEMDHPTLGKVLVGGGTKFHDRIPPPFMIEEECHRNFAFTMFHADNMPLLKFALTEVKSLGPSLWQLTVEIANEKIIPSRLGVAAHKKIGLPDRLTVSGAGVTVVASGTLRDRFDKTFEPVKYRRDTIFNDTGIPGEGQRAFRFIVTGSAGAKVHLRYTAEKARMIETDVELREPAQP